MELLMFQRSNFAILIILSAITLPLTAFASFDVIEFNYSSINSNNHELVYQGDASPASSDIEVTRNQWNADLQLSIGRAVYYKPMHLWDNATGNTADFATQFFFAIDSKNSSLFADGLAFFLAPNGSGIPVNSTGGKLGLLANVSGDLPFVAVEFDTYGNGFDPYGFAPHVGIDMNSVISATTTRWSWNNITLGGRLEALVTYNSSTQNLSVVLTDGSSDITKSSSLWYKVQLKDRLPEWVTFGFSATTGTLFELHTIYSWQFNSSLEVADPTGNSTRGTPRAPAPPTSNKSKTWMWAVIGLSCFVFLSLIVMFHDIWGKIKHKKFEGEDDDDDDGLPIDEEFEKVSGPKRFSHRELVIATDNFAEYQVLGQGDFGKVYKGYLSEMGSNVAIKKITPGSSQWMKEFAAEVTVVSQLRQRSLVQLIGWCHWKKELILIYEFMLNSSLDAHLFKGKSLLTWEVRYKIAQDMASALLYLHEECSQCVVHRDIKCSNIMLDSSYNAKLGDFGLARLVDHGKGSQTTVLAGTMGYMAPECLYTGKASKESDVYSFGIVALEITCGRRVFEPAAKEEQARLTDWVWGLYGTGSLLEAADPKLGCKFDVREMACLMIVGMWCAHPDSANRPSMREALSVLSLNSAPPILPLEMPRPTYSSPPSVMSELSWVSSYGISRSSDGGSLTTKSSRSATSTNVTAVSASSSS